MTDKINDQHIIWVDLEMTGLDIEKDHIIEIAVLITDGNLNVLDEGVNIIIHQSDEILEKMNDFVKNMHTENGLIEKVKESKVSLKEAEDLILNYLSSKNIAPGKCPIAGNSVYYDKFFLMKYMPKFYSFLHYRVIDVSSIKELYYRWYPNPIKTPPEKLLLHRALDDIVESIKELKWYKQNLFVDKL